MRLRSLAIALVATGVATSCAADRAPAEPASIDSINQALTAGYFNFFSGDARGYTGDGDWSSGNWKGECATNQAVTGISVENSTDRPRKLQCEDGRASWGSTTATVSPYGGDSRRDTSTGDWASGYYKGECGLSEVVVGVSDMNGAVHDLRCAPKGGTVSSVSCNTRNVGSGDDRGRTSTGDWDFGYYKSECADGQYVKGVSLYTDSKKPRSILCCTAGGGGGSMKTVGYVVSWVTNVSIQYNKLTHINYAFTVPNADGSLTRNPENPAWLQTVVSGAHAAGGKVLISAGGWMADSPNPAAFASIVNNSTYRANFVNNLDTIVTTYGLDGVDIDYEYPCPGGYGNGYATLMSDLATRFHGKGKHVTAAVAGYSTRENNSTNSSCIGSSVMNSVDWVNVMAYDFRDPDHSNYQDAVDSITYWKNTRGFPASKVVLGLPFYAHPTWAAFNTLVPTYGACVDTGGGQYWNGLTTIRSKSTYARNNAGGVMAWEMSQDATGANSAVTAMYEAVNGLARSGSCP